MVAPHEEVVNVVLAEVLRKKFGIDAVPENQTLRRKRFDVYLTHKSIPFVLEASYEENDAENDAKKRLEEGLIDTATVAIHYDPVDFDNKSTSPEIEDVLETQDLKVKVFTSGEDVSGTLLGYLHQSARLEPREESGWILVRISDFNTLLDSIIELMIKEDVVGKFVKSLEDEISIFVVELSRAISNRSDSATIISEFYKVMYSPGDNTDAAIVVPDVPNEVLFSNIYLSLFFSAILYEATLEATELNSIQTLLRDRNRDILRTLSECFDNIMKIDYRAIFNQSKKIVDYLFNLQYSTPVIDRIRSMINLSTDVLRQRAILRQDFVGKLYHKITGDLSTKKAYATYYTKIPIAIFLSTLIMETPGGPADLDFSGIENLNSFHGADLACGSGTLISALYNSILGKYVKDSIRTENTDITRLHRLLVQDTLIGIDALSNSVQIASLVESLHNPSVKLEHLNNFHIPVDPSGSLGSLNLWYSNNLLSANVADLDERDKTQHMSLPKFDVIIMNPPFSRSTARGIKDARPTIFNFITDDRGYKKLWSQYSTLIEQMQNSVMRVNNIKSHGRFKRKQGKFITTYDEFVGPGKRFSPRDISPINAGAVLPFIFLADSYLNVNGRLGLVLPRTVLENSSYFLVRDLLQSKYEVEYIVSSDDPQNYNFSYSTNLSEILLILKKININEIKNKTRIVKFLRQPANSLEGVMMARQLISSHGSIISAGNSAANATEIERSQLEKFTWNWSIFTNLPISVLKVLGEIIDGGLFSRDVKLVTFSELNSQSELLKLFDSRPLRGTGLTDRFRLDINGNHKLVVTCGREQMRKLTSSDTAFKRVSDISSDSIQFFNDKSGRVIIPRSFEFDSLPLFATFSEEPVISREPYIARLSNIEQEKALVAWLNSSLALLVLRVTTSTVRGIKWVHLNVWQAKSLLYPNLKDKRLVRRLAKVWENYKDQYWEELPKQFENAISNSRSPRMNYDIDVIKAIDPNNDIEITKQKLMDIYIGMKELLSSDYEHHGSENMIVRKLTDGL